MNKKILVPVFVLVFFILLPQALWAQYSRQSIAGSAWLGVTAGASFASETFDSLPENASNGLTTGAMAGITLEYFLDNNWALNIGVQFDQKGTDELYAASAINRQVPPSTGPIYSGTDNFSFSYFEIPILLKYALGDGDVRPYICAGPSIGYLLSASETVTGTLSPVDNLKSYMASTDISIYAGLGVMDEIYHGPILFFEAGYAAGMTDLFKTTPARVAPDGTPFPDPIDPTSAKSGDIRVSVGAMWQL